MKKVLSLVLVAVMLFVVAGCGGTTSSSTPAASGSEAAPSGSEAASGTKVTMWRIGTASMTGNSYTTGSAVAQMINEKVDGAEAAAQATGGSGDNCYLLNDKEIELGWIQSATAMEAVSGTGAFEGEKIESMRGVGVVQLNTFHVIVNNKSNVEKIEDLAGKKIGVGPMGGGVEVNAKILLGEFGVEDFDSIYGTMGEALEAVKNGEVDAVVYATTTGSANISDALNSGNCKLIGMSQEKADEIVAARPEFGPAVIPANSYQDQPEDVYTIAGTMLVLTREDISEDDVYTITKALYENNDFLVSQNAIFKDATLENAAVGMCVPFHPGAEKYLKEKGIL